MTKKGKGKGKKGTGSIPQYRITLRQVVEAFHAAQSLMRGKVLPLTGALSIQRLYRSLKPEAEMFQDLYNKLVQEYVMKDEAGEPVYTDESKSSVRIQDSAAFNSAVEKLLDNESKFQAEPLKISSLVGVQTEPWVLDALLEAGLAEDV